MPEALARQGALRVAVVWVESGPHRLVVSADKRVNAARFDLKFELPDLVDFNRVIPLEQLLVADDDYAFTNTSHYVITDQVWAAAYRPRVLVYEDDGDRQLDLSKDSLDRIVLSDTVTGPAALQDPEGTLQKLTLEQTNRYYETNPRFARFVLTSGWQGQLNLLKRAPVALSPSSHVGQREDVLCGRSVLSSAAAAETRIVVDASLDEDAYCFDGADCSRTPLGEIDAPPLQSAPDARRVAQCRSSEAAEALVVATTTTECEHCACRDVVTADAWVAPAGRLPAWWPCGYDAPYCVPDERPVVSFGLCPLQHTAVGVDGGLRDGGAAALKSEAGLAQPSDAGASR
jgi:hypothetical protein